ncbi:hypothetical protein TorRG33x02_316980 [Trema orientale]|uniref:Uncharacterized protein n=1 Tax=Trema orientale TaxID=63057 RepID=A0A2P5BL98_TREOI|nr:hypothetical protein TorRG33x02_316980 [Trema orientale]
MEAVPFKAIVESKRSFDVHSHLRPKTKQSRPIQSRFRKEATGHKLANPSSLQDEKLAFVLGDSGIGCGTGLVASIGLSART